MSYTLPGMLTEEESWLLLNNPHQLRQLDNTWWKNKTGVTCNSFTRRRNAGCDGIHQVVVNFCLMQWATHPYFPPEGISEEYKESPCSGCSSKNYRRSRNPDPAACVGSSSYLGYLTRAAYWAAELVSPRRVRKRVTWVLRLQGLNCTPFPETCREPDAAKQRGKQYRNLFWKSRCCSDTLLGIRTSI